LGGAYDSHLFFYNHVVLEPHGSHELVARLALTRSLVEAQRYRCLASL